MAYSMNATSTMQNVPMGWSTNAMTYLPTASPVYTEPEKPAEKPAVVDFGERPRRRIIRPQVPVE